MPELLEKTAFIGLRVPQELKDRITALDQRLKASMKARHRLAPSYAHSFSVTARAILETGLAAMEKALKNGVPKNSHANPRKKQG